MKTVVLDLQIACANEDNLPTLVEFQKWVDAAILPERVQSELTLRIVDNDEIQTLNQLYRGKNKPTNVLSFPCDSFDNLVIPLLGDIVICKSIVEEESTEQHKTLSAHWAHIVIHGSLHLLGYDHVSEIDAEIMESLERQVLHSLGFADPYIITENFL